jgi:hypothetical protein
MLYPEGHGLALMSACHFGFIKAVHTAIAEVSNMRFA